MDALLKAALAGTARGAAAPDAPATPADALVADMGNLEPERRVLLAAGARAIYRQAGRQAPIAAPAPIPAPEEPLPVCPPGVARLLADIFAGRQADLLPEACARLRGAGLRLPPGLLPAALTAGSRKADLRPALAAVVGERGRWLGGLNPEWRWVADAAPDLDGDGGVPADAAAAWEEGTPGRRLAVLRLVRAHDPARARDWLGGVWKGEKADFRVEAIGTLETGLSLDDEPFLETALGDRSQAVRAEAATLLARLPESALGTRLRERADQFLAFTPGLPASGWRAAAKALVKGVAGGRLTVTPPERYDKAWARDGIAEQLPNGTGSRAWWLQQFLALIPPAHWSERFQADPATLIAATEGGEWTDIVLSGWKQAAVRHRDEAWATALWKHWIDAPNGQRLPGEVRQMVSDLTACLPPYQAEQVMLAAITRTKSLEDRFYNAFQRLPRPWSVAFGNVVLQLLRAWLRDVRQPGQTNKSWIYLLPDIAIALPAGCINETLAILQTVESGTQPAPDDWTQRRITDFGDLIRARRRLVEEIPL